jgi:hypothetical protein
VLAPVGSLSPALPPTPAPEPVGDPATRDMVVAAYHRAGLSLNEDQIAMICAAAPYVTAMTQWLRANTISGTSPPTSSNSLAEHRLADEVRLTRLWLASRHEAATPEAVRKISAANDRYILGACG